MEIVKAEQEKCGSSLESRCNLRAPAPSERGVYVSRPVLQSEPHSFTLHSLSVTNILKQHQEEGKCQQKNLSSRYLAGAAMRHYFFYLFGCFNLGRKRFTSSYSL